MSWQERYQSKMNRSSWKIAHNDSHPQIEDKYDLESHLMSHHSGDFIGDIDDHEWYHLDPDGYNDFHHEHNFPIEDNQPDHHHTYDYGRAGVPNVLPKSFASFNKQADPGSLRGEGASAFTEPSYQDDQDPDEQVVGPQDLDSNATTVDKFPKSVGVFKNSFSEFGQPMNDGANRMQDVEDTSRLQSRFPLDTGKRPYAEQRADANPLTLRSWFTGDDVNGPWPHTKNLSGPLDFEPTDDQNEDSTGPIMGSVNEDGGTYEPPEEEELEQYPVLDKIREKYPYNSKTSHFEGIAHPFPTEENIHEHLLTHHFGENPVGDDYLKQPSRDRPPLSNKELLGEHLNFHYDDRLGENSLVGKSSWSRYHEHDNNLKVDVPDNIAKLAHNDHHPWPNNAWELENHLDSHHMPHWSNNPNVRIPAKELIQEAGIQKLFESHEASHKHPEFKTNSPNPHDHDDNFDMDIPENIETIAPTYITSSWHQSFVETFDTHPDEETPDSLLNPADELKNGRPRANDLPNQSAQMIPGMLIDHDAMGGSGTDSAGF